MALFHRKDDWYRELQDQQRKSFLKSYTERKRESVRRDFSAPLLPKLSKILFYLMLILTGAMVVVELNSYFRYTRSLGVRHFLVNLFTTGLAIWSICAAILLLVCFIGIRVNTKNYWKKKPQRGQTRSEEEQQRDKRALRRLNAVYRRYILVGLIGFVCWLIFNLIVFIS